MTPIEYEQTAIDVLSDVNLTDLTHRDAQFVKAELIEKIAAAIAAAVQAEREAILDFADKSETHYNAYGELLDFIRALNEVKA